MDNIRRNAEAVNVPVIDGRERGWQEAVSHLLRQRKNFLLIVTQSAESIDEVDQLIGYAPAPLAKWHINSVSDLVNAGHRDHLLDAQTKGDFVFLIENLKRPDIKPPSTKPYVAYCELRGLVGEAESLEQAQEICNQYSNTIKKAKARPFVRVHHWNGSNWKPVNPFGC